MPSSAEAEAEWLDDALQRYHASRAVELRDEIVLHTLWLATRGARRFSDKGEPFDDLVQVARIGLLKALDRFEPSLGVPFGAYATPTIMGELRRHFRDRTWSVHVPRRAKDLRPAVNEARDHLAATLGRSPQVDEIAAHLHLDPTVVLEVLEANNAYRAQSIDPLGARLAPTVEGNFELVLDREILATLLERLQPRQRRILHLRFFEELSQAQIAEQIGTSQVHVGRLITASLAELRRHLPPEDGA